VRGLREERSQNLLHVPALAIRALGSLLPVLGDGFDAIEHVLALTAAIFIDRHGASIGFFYPE
jgi:hypothetical protein